MLGTAIRPSDCVPWGKYEMLSALCSITCMLQCDKGGGDDLRALWVTWLHHLSLNAKASTTYAQPSSPRFLAETSTEVWFLICPMNSLRRCVASRCNCLCVSFCMRNKELVIPVAKQSGGFLHGASKEVTNLPLQWLLKQNRYGSCLGEQIQACKHRTTCAYTRLCLHNTTC